MGVGMGLGRGAARSRWLSGDHVITVSQWERGALRWGSCLGILFLHSGVLLLRLVCRIHSNIFYNSMFMTVTRVVF